MHFVDQLLEEGIKIVVVIEGCWIRWQFLEPSTALDGPQHHATMATVETVETLPLDERTYEKIDKVV